MNVLNSISLNFGPYRKNFNLAIFYCFDGALKLFRVCTLPFLFAGDVPAAGSPLL